MAWIPLRHGEAAIVMHEIAVCVEKRAVPAGFELRKTRHWKCRGDGFSASVRDPCGVVDEGSCSRQVALITRVCTRVEEEARCCGIRFLRGMGRRAHCVPAWTAIAWCEEERCSKPTHDVPSNFFPLLESERDSVTFAEFAQSLAGADVPNGS